MQVGACSPDLFPESLSIGRARLGFYPNRTEHCDYDRYLSKDRNLVERFFKRIKQFRRIATRYDKLDLCLHLACQQALVSLHPLILEHTAIEDDPVEGHLIEAQHLTAMAAGKDPGLLLAAKGG